MADGLAAEKNSSYRAALESITSEDLARHVNYLADDTLEGREAGTRGGRAAGDYLHAELQSLGLQPAGADGAYSQPFAPNLRNLLGLLEGYDPALNDQVIIVCAHYDHVGYGTYRNSHGPVGQIHNGADDNASGTSAVLELAQAFTLLPQPPNRSILFAFWDAEEKGLLGSRYWCAHPTLPLDRVALVLNLDMIGHLQHDCLTVFGSRTGYGLRRLVSQQNDESGLLLDFSWYMKANADHYPFFQQGIPVLMMHTGEDEHYHTPRDKADLIDAKGMRRLTRFLFQIACELANRPQLPQVRQAAGQETPETERGLLLARPRFADRLGAMWQQQGWAADGVRLTWVAPASAADQAALRPGDHILRFAGREVHTGDELGAAVRSAENPVALLVQRPGDEEPLELTAELPGNPVRLGIMWRVDDAEPGTAILTYVAPDSPAAQAGLIAGDRIYQVAGQDFSDDRRFAELVRTLPSPLELLIERNGQLHRVTIHFAAEQLKRAA